MAALFADSRINGVAKISIKSSFMAVDFLCAFSRSDVPRKSSSVRSKPADSSVLSLWRKGRKGATGANQLSSLMQLRYHTFTSPVEASNLTVVSKSPPVYVNDSANNLTTSQICPLRRQKSVEPWIQN